MLSLLGRCLCVTFRIRGRGTLFHNGLVVPTQLTSKYFVSCIWYLVFGIWYLVFGILPST